MSYAKKKKKIQLAELKTKFRLNQLKFFSHLMVCG